MGFTVAIIGRPNVGKSTLFNRLVGRKLALVDDQPGVTRDRRMAEGSLGELEFDLIDTAGLEDSIDDSLEGRMRAQTDLAVEEADLCLFLIDARAGVTPLDSHFAGLLRKVEKPVLLLANKCEGRVGESGLYEAYELGLGDPIAISAEHGHGLGTLQDEIMPFYDAWLAESLKQAEAADAEAEQPLRVAVVGRPNAGKSTLINQMIGEDRLLTGPEAGITRDSISVEWTWASRDGDRQRRLKLFDTAGMRKKARVTGKIEKLSVADGLRAVRFAEVVVVLIDAMVPLEKQDLHIADLVVREGRGIVIAVNKWDLVEERDAVLKELRLRVEELLPQIRGVPFITLSALTGRGINRLVPAILDAEDGWNARIPTGELNRWLEVMQERHPPPTDAGRRVRLRYMTQAKSRPPTFAIFSSRADAVPDSYVRYLINGLRENFGLQGVPLRLNLRKGNNPYADRKAAAKTKKGQAKKSK